MMRYLRIPLGIAALLSVASCGKEALEAPAAPEKNMVPVTVTASVPQTRTLLQGRTPVWEQGDRIGFFTADYDFCPAFTAGEGGTATTTFSGLKPEYSDLTVAFYPYDESAEFDDGTLHLRLPGEQSGRPGEAVMVGTGDEGDGFSFANVCCLVKMNVPASLGLRKIELVRSDQVSGAFRVDTDRFPLRAAGSSSLSDYRDMRAVLNGSSTLSGEQYLSVIPSSSTRLELALTNAAGKVGFIATNFSSGVPYTEGRLKNLGSLPATIQFYDAALVADPTSQQL